MSEAPTTSAGRTAILAGYRIVDTEPEQLYDDLLYLAVDICEAPIAAVGLVEDGREWFKAQVGIEMPEIGIESSIGALGLDAEGLFVVPDLKRDPRTEESAIVTGPPRLRFYAGAPLVTASGDRIGMLAVMDRFPRQGGLTARQQRALTALARQATISIDMHRLLCEFGMPPLDDRPLPQ